MFILRFLALLITFSFFANVYGQTAGSGIVSRIESLAQQELANSEKVGELNRKHMDTYVLEDLKLKRLEEELRELEKKQLQTEMAVEEELAAKLDEIENSQQWKNRRESAERGYKEYNPGTCSAGGPPPICTADHWYRVSYDEAMREYNALVEKELNAIRDKKNKADGALVAKRKELTDFQFGENEFAKKRYELSAEMDKLTDENSDIRAQIQALSKEYVDKINSEAKSRLNSDLKPWLQTIAMKHYTELNIGILEAKISELNEEESQAIIKLRDKLDKENQEKINQKEQRVNLIKTELNTYLIRTTDEISQDQSELRKRRTSLREVEKELEKKGELSPEEVDKLENTKAKLENEIAQLEQRIEGQERDQKLEKERREGEIKQLESEIWDLKINLPSLKLQAENDLKEAYGAKREILEDAIEGRKLKLESLIAEIRNHEQSFRSKVTDYTNIVDTERLRLMDACSVSGSTCWGSSIVGDVWGLANQLISCAFQIENDTIRYSGCEEANEHYRSDYNLLVNGISDRDLGILRKQNSNYQYENLLKKFN